MLSNVDGKISYEVETIALDNYPFDLSRPIDLVKIDVEMHEPEVISGMIKIIKDHKPAIIIEILNDEIGKKIEKLIMGLGYLYFSIDENTPPKRVDYISKSDFHNFLLCTPAIAKKLNL